MSIPASPLPTSTRRAPARASLSLVGDTLHYLHHADRYLTALHARHTDAVRVRLFGKRWTILFGPDANQFVLQNRGEHFTTAIWEYFFGPFFQRGLLMLDFDEHRLHRSIMAGAFRREALERYLPVIDGRIRAKIDGWLRDTSFCAYPSLKAMALVSGCEVFIGTPPGDDAHVIQRALLDLVRAPSGLVRFDVPGTRWHAGISGRRVLERYIRSLLPRKRADGEAVDLLAQLCHARNEDGAPFSDDDVLNHIVMILMAAHDTVTGPLTSMLYFLAANPEWQERLRVAALAHGDGTPTYDDLLAMEELDWVMREALRLIVPVPLMPRRVHRACVFRGIAFAAGENVMLSPWVTHHDAAWWEAPERFDPERFAPTRAEHKRHPFQWIPFGGGAHKCIGMLFGEMEVKAAMFRILRRFRWRLPENYRLRISWVSSPAPHDGLPLRLELL